MTGSYISRSTWAEPSMTTSDSDILIHSYASGLEIMANLSSKNEEMVRCLELAQISCKSSAPVMITGENGVGKSLLAMAIHYNSPKRALPCVSLKCAHMREHEIKSKLFGDAEKANPGLLKKAAGGTLIIDAVDQLPGFVQKELLALLMDRHNGSGQSGTGSSAAGRRLGSRLISTSSNELSLKTTTGFFDEDLMYCLGEITIRIPPLRDRREDIVDLAETAVKAANRTYGKNVKKLSRTASDFIRHYEFPGNVRELFLIINRAVRQASRDIIYVEDLGLVTDSASQDPHLAPEMTLLPLWEMEKRHISKALLRTGWKKAAAARILLISETMLNRKIKLYGLERGSRVT